MTTAHSVFRSALLSCAFFIICTAGSQAQAQSGFGSIAAEATIYETPVGDNGGGYPDVCIGNLASTNSTRRGYIRYDLPAIPAGSTITRVRLTVIQDRVRGNGPGAPKTATLQLRRVSSSWTEGSGGLSTRACGGGSNAAGIDWAGAPGNSATDSAIANLPMTSTTVTFDTDIGTDDDGLIEDVQAWTDDGASNFGWRLTVSEEGTADNARLMTPGSLTVDWTTPDPEINVQGNNTTIVDGDSTPALGDHTNFGSADTAGGMVTRTFTIQNTGDADLLLINVPRVAVGGTNAADFSVGLQPASPVSAAGSTTFQVTFDPSAAGTRTATLSIMNNDSDENPYNFSIQGTGTSSFTVGGALSGLAPGNSIELQNNGGDNLVINADGNFTFATALPEGNVYAVTVLTQPTSPNQTCSVTSGNGNLAGADVTNVSVTCVTDTFTIGGNVSGLSGSGLVLQNNGGDNLPIGADGGFAFSSPLADGSTYTVSVFAQPGNPSQSCTVTNGSGTLAGNNVTDVVVTCVIDNFTIGGNVNGLSGSGLTLRNNGGNNLTINGNGPFSFSTPLENGQTYSVTVLNQPSNPTQVCTVNNGSGTVSGANVSNISVSCVTNTFTIGGNVSGLSGSGLVLRNNGGNNLSINNDGIFTFSIPLADGSAYLVTVFAQPVNPTQICSVANGSGNLSGDDVTNVLISCNTRPVTVADSYSIDEDDSLNADDTDGQATSDLNDNGVLANDSDAENDALTVVNTGPFTAGGLGGTIVITSNGTFSYTPPSDQSGVATHDFNVTDGVHIVPGSLSIDVQAVNDPPSFQNNGNVNFPQGGLGPTEIAGWATSINAGPADESTQLLTFLTQVISDPDGILNSVSVALDGDLQLDLTSEGGSASVEVTLMDNGEGDDQSPAVQFDVNVTRAADLVVDMDNGRNSLPGGGVAVYRLTVENLGPADVTGATVIANIPAPLANATWTCLGAGGSSCPANGIGDVSESVDVPRGERVTFDITVDVPKTPEQPVSFTAQAQIPGDTLEITPANNTDTDTDTIGLFGDSFESPPD